MGTKNKMNITANKQFVKDFSSSHYYQLTDDGQVVPQYEATLREARKLKLFPSPTTIEKDIRANPTLARWIKNEVAKAFVGNPRFPGEDEETYAARCLAISDSIAKDAAKKGTAIHDAIEHGYTSDPAIKPFLDAYLPWQDDNVESTVAKEASLADDRIGVAGRVDRIIMHKQHGLVIVDYKTQKVKKTANFYESFPRQLSLYSGAYQHMHGGELPRIMSVVIDSQTPSLPIEKLYTREEQENAHLEFLTQAWLWFNERDFWPVGRWNPSFSFLK